MKKLAISLTLCMAVAVGAQAQLLPKLKDKSSKHFGISPFLTDSIAKLPGLNNTLLNKTQLREESTLTFYSNMPTVKPQGNYKMPVVDPATPGVKYTMLVKKIGDYQSVDTKLP